MAEIYRDNQVTISLGIPVATNVSAVITRNGVQVGSTITSDTFSLPFAVYGVDGPFTVTWTFSVDGQTYTRTEAHDIVTPYATLDEIRSVISDTSFTDDELKTAERKVRYIINTYTGQNFGRWEGKIPVLGTGDTRLTLPSRLLSIKGISGSNIVTDATYYQPLGNGWYLGGARPVPDGDWVFENVIRAPDERWSSIFLDDVTYVIDGVWGYPDVPSDVKEAALIIIEDSLCPETEYRDRYIGTATTSWAFSFTPNAFRGTGSVTADQLLSNYRRFKATVI